MTFHISELGGQFYSPPSWWPAGRTIDLSMSHLVEILKKIAINLWFLIFKVMRITFATVSSLENKIHRSFREKQ